MMSLSYPLLSGYPSLHSPFAYGLTGSATVGIFLQQLRQQTEQLPNGFDYVLNLCENRYAFCLAFSAALTKKYTVLLPPNRKTAIILALLQQYPNTLCLVDKPREDLSHVAQFHMNLPDLDWHSSAAELSIPRIEAHQIAVIVFTSGSTGEAQPHSKSWRQLVQGVAMAQTSLVVPEKAAIMGTVAAQHLFGLEATLLWPMQTGRAFYMGQPHLLADITAQLSHSTAPTILVSTPLQLKSLLNFAYTPQLVAILSATMPFDRTLAQALVKNCPCQLIDIYGSSETGMFAQRAPHQNQEWTLLHGATLIQQQEQIFLDSPLLAQPYCLQDNISIQDARHFEVQGRREDMIKIAGKRTSLATLNQALLAIEGVEDGVFYLPEHASRLTAYVVAPHLTIRMLLDALSEKIDSAFLPRPLYKITALPRSGVGKLAQSDLQDLFVRLQAESQQRV